ncbi:metabolite traffic protein EboE [Rapidithrix thailandica]|uniref:Metabolite traffic protein EboE n=1 Tax=Rapidithrix thailandica TaxID=413964 RepID=A0AAW9S252_9BACT
MLLSQSPYHLTYCTNIHPGETWDEVFASLKKYLPEVKAKATQPGQRMGVGLRLSHKASEEILEKDHLATFQRWLESQGMYVFTMNGFPYGGFHHQRVKDTVHQPDWTTLERVNYTKRLFSILAALLPEGQTGGISTSPLSYKLWLTKAADRKQGFELATRNLLQVVEHLYQLEQETGKFMHLDIEPEPDGLLENTQEVLDYYQTYLYPFAKQVLPERIGVDSGQVEALIKKYVQICYDVCHFAVEYEEPGQVFQAFENAGIQIGKIQISAALKADIPEEPISRSKIHKEFLPFVESTYLHQVIARNQDGSLTNFSDLPEALESLESSPAVEWRTHFHVPLFVEAYQWLKSTQADIVKVVNLLKEKAYTEHLEVETYTWEVLPEDIRLPLGESIARELNWVKERIEQE